MAVEGVSVVTIQPDPPGTFVTVHTVVNDGVLDYCLYTPAGYDKPTFINALEVLKVRNRLLPLIPYVSLHLLNPSCSLRYSIG